MGWASGSGILESVWRIVREWIDEEHREHVLRDLMLVFAKHDCDTLDELITEKWPETEGAYKQFRERRKR